MTDTWTPTEAPDVPKNGGEGRKARVKFGPKPHQTVPHEWAELMLTDLFMRYRKVFGAVLSNASGVNDD
jgi:hypothetical protein